MSVHNSQLRFFISYFFIIILSIGILILLRNLCEMVHGAPELLLVIINLRAKFQKNMSISKYGEAQSVSSEHGVQKLQSSNPEFRIVKSIQK